MWTDVLIPLVIFGTGVVIVKLVLDYKLRRQILEKGPVDDKAQRFLLREAELARLSSLKWGMVLVGLGIALLVGYMNPDMFDDGGVFGLMLVLAGIGFLIYFAV
ncbi:MAG TPA: hypothetical protein PKY95_10930, partial [candidate division Zixibacteria bacterium]|nr:hypothetical protein [candidate division Zixibacteria bacterium]